VIHRTPAEIVVAADSKPSSNADKASLEPACKIRSLDGFYFALAGKVQYRDKPLFGTPINFDAVALVSSAWKETTGTFEDRSEAAFTKIKSEYAEYVATLQERRTDYSNIREGLILEIAFFGIENGITKVSKVKLAPVNDRGLFSNDPDVASVSSMACPTDCPNGTHTFFLGTYGDILDAFGEEKPFEVATKLWHGTSVKVARKMVELEVAKHGGSVGPPIDILRLTKNGTQWIQRKKECQEPKQQTPRAKPKARHKV
jgi:hypothetical protein